MTSVKLKKLLAKEEILKTIKEIKDALNANIIIEDKNSILYGEEKDDIGTEKYTIEVNGDVIGFVRGDTKASAIATLIKAFGESEFEKKKLAEDSLQKYREINLLYNISERIATTIGINNVTRLVINEAMKHIECTCASIMIIDEDSGNLNVVTEIFKKSDKQIISNYGNPIMRTDESVIKSVISKKTGEIINDTSIDDRYSKDSKNFSSIICAPLKVKNKVIGVIIIGNESPVNYKAEDLKLCNSLGVQAGISIENARLYDSLRESFFDTVQVLTEIIELRETKGSGSIKRVLNYSLNIAKALGISKVEQVKLKLAVMLRDIGNIGINDELLNKKGSLSEEEYELFKRHSIIGYEMLKKIDQLKEVSGIIRAHHERYDGTGYPDGLKGEEIPILSRILAVADAFESMTVTRQNREAMNLYFVAEDFRNNKGIQFDPKVVETFFEIYKDKKLEEIQEYIYNE